MIEIICSLLIGLLVGFVAAWEIQQQRVHKIQLRAILACLKELERKNYPVQAAIKVTAKELTK